MRLVDLVSEPQSSENQAPSGRPLRESDAIEIWIARWLRVPRKDLISRYGCDSRRLYDIWWGQQFPGSRAKAAEAFQHRFPHLADRTVFGYRRIPRVVHDVPSRQADLFS